MLESRLTESARRRLDRRLAPIEYALGEAGRAAFDECSAVKKKLINRPDRIIALSAWPRDADPRYPQVLRARKEIENKGLGAVWVDFVEGDDVHFIVKWKEWPILKSLRDEQYQLIVRRREAVQRWIEEEFERSGMKLFRGS